MFKLFITKTFITLSITLWFTAEMDIWRVEHILIGRCIAWYFIEIYFIVFIKDLIERSITLRIVAGFRIWRVEVVFISMCLETTCYIPASEVHVIIL